MSGLQKVFAGQDQWAPSIFYAKAFRNDTGTVASIAARDAYQRTAESDCKSAHPVASKITGVGRKPYTNCVNDKMSFYDTQATADADTQRQIASDTSFSSTVSSALGTPSTTTTTTTASADNTPIYLVLVIVLLGAGYYWWTHRTPAVAPATQEPGSPATGAAQ